MVNEQVCVKPVFKSQKVVVTRDSLRFRLTMNIIGICGPLLQGLVILMRDNLETFEKDIAMGMFVLAFVGFLGFILSCIDYAKAE